MAGAAVATADADVEAPAKPAGGKRKLILLAVPVVLVAVVAGLWFSGILPPLLGMGGAAHAEAKADGHGADAHGAKPDAHGAKPAAKAESHGAKPAEGGKPGEAKAGGSDIGPNYAELPDIVANLNAGPRRSVYVKLRSRIELAKPEDEAAVRAAIPRLQDLFQTYLREMRPEELRGSAGTYRLREELIARANVALAPLRVQDLLFTELLIQ